VDGNKMNLYRSGLKEIQGRWFKMKDYSGNGNYDWGYVARVHFFHPQVSGFFSSTVNPKLDKKSGVFFDYIEFIPLKEFKDEKLANSLPLISL